jgi:DNA-directed RNA polymerase specialized sigma24 family protein
VADEQTFEQFAGRYGPHLYEALIPVAGLDAAHDAASDALVYAWRHWERVRGLDNPEGYLYVMARRRATKSQPAARSPLPMPSPTELPDVEPDLVDALGDLSEMQRQVVYLVEGFGWGLTDVARILDISVSTVRNHLARGLDHLRARLHVDVAAPGAARERDVAAPSAATEG